MEQIQFPEYVKECPQGVLEKEIEITGEQTEDNGSMKLQALAKEMEKITEEHLSMFGIGREQLQREGRIWVVAWHSVWLCRLPKKGERILLRMWPSKNKSMMYTRKYACYTKTGEVLACTSSLFVLMDSKTREVSMPTKQMEQIPVVSVPGEPKTPKLRIDLPQFLPESIKRTVQPEEIDQNGHLNNTYYLDWAMDLAKGSGFEGKEPHFVWIRYSKELKEGQEAELYYGTQEDAFFVQGISRESESFLVKIEY